MDAISANDPFVAGRLAAEIPSFGDRSEDSSRAPGIAALREDDEASISLAARLRAEAERRAEESDDRPGSDLDAADEATLRELEARDREVRAHERAHKAAAGDLAVGGPTYVYQVGPDGKRYAIGGEVRIQLRSGRTPEETVRNMQRAQRAAHAPASPSAPDMAVAAMAARLETDARSEMSDPKADEERAPRRVDTFA